MFSTFYDRHDRPIPPIELTWGSLATIAPPVPTPIAAAPPRSPDHVIDARDVEPETLLPIGRRVVAAGPFAWALCTTSKLHTIHHRLSGDLAVVPGAERLYTVGSDGMLSAWSLTSERELYALPIGSGEHLRCMLVDVSGPHVLEVDTIVGRAWQMTIPLTQIEVADLTGAGPPRDGLATGVKTELVFYGEHNTNAATKDEHRLVLAGDGFVAELDRAGQPRWVGQSDFITSGVELIGAHVGVIIDRPRPQLLILDGDGAAKGIVEISRAARFIGRATRGAWIGDGTRALLVDRSGQAAVHLLFDDAVVAAAPLPGHRTAVAAGSSVHIWHAERGVIDRLQASDAIRAVAMADGVLFAATEYEILTWKL